MFNPTVPVSECCVVVIDPHHPRFGMVADITFHDWLEDGKVTVCFEDEERMDFDDGLMSNEPSPPQVFILKKSDRGKIPDMQKRLASMREALSEKNMTARSIDEDTHVCLAAKKDFWEMIKSATYEYLGY